MSAGRTGSPVDAQRTTRDSGANAQPAGPWPGFGGTPPAIALSGSAGATGLASDAGHTHAYTFNEVAGTGPTALGAVGSGLPGHATQTHPAYRSDIPVSTTWFIDTTTPGSDASSNGGTTSATSLATPDELNRRLWGVEFKSNTSITILGNLTTSPAWNFKCRPGVTVTLTGSTGSTTGFGGGAINNTLFTGTVTAFTAASATPAADDIELTDSGIPTSFTASGAMAEGVILKRTNSTALWWYALKDLGSKKLRISAPMLTVRVAMSSALAVNDTYACYQAWTIPTQQWGDSVGSVAYDTLYVNTGTSVAQGAICGRPTRVWFGIGPNNGTYLYGAGASSFPPTNCMFSGGASGSPNVFNARGATLFIGGGAARGTGAGTQILTFQGTQSVCITSAFVCQGIAINVENTAEVILEAALAIHDVTALGMIQGFNGGRFIFGLNGVTGGYGLSGKGNTAKILSLADGFSVEWESNSAAPPFVTGSTTDLTPIAIATAGGVLNYVVADLPTVNYVRVSGVDGQFPRMGVIKSWSGCLLTSTVDPTFTYLSDPGPDGQGSNRLDRCRYPTSARTAQRLWVTWLGGAAANAINVTLYKNGSATAITVAIPGGTTVGTKFSCTTHTISFADGDDMDLRIDDAADASSDNENPPEITATLEGF